MAFNYIEYRRESNRENASSGSSEENSAGEEGPKAETTATDASSRENCNWSVEEKLATNSTEETKQTPEHVCESCLEDFGIEKPASRKVRMTGREQWLCDTCLQAAGYREELD